MKKKLFQLSNLSQPVFLLDNPTQWGLETAVCPIIAKPVLDIFAVCSLVPSMNFSHTQHSYLCPKKQNYLLEKSNYNFQYFFMLQTIFQAVIVETHAKNTDSFNKTFF